MMNKIIYISILAIVLIFFQQNFLNVFNFLSNLNILLVVLVFFIIAVGFNQSFILASLISLLAGFFSAFPFGTFIIVYFSILFIVNILYKQVFINLSFYTSLILIIFATILYNLLVVALAYIFFQLKLIDFFLPLDGQWLASFIIQIILNLSAIVLIFIIAKFTYKKLNLAFIAKHE